MSIREVSRRWGLPWCYLMRLTRDWADLVAAQRRRRRCRVLLIDETSLRRGHRYVTVIVNGDTGETLDVIKHRHGGALSQFLLKQSRSWRRGVKVALHRRVDPAGGRLSNNTWATPPVSSTVSTSPGGSPPG